MLAMRSISKSFSGVRVLDSVDFSVEAGEIHALLGANGAGKSTLIKVLGGEYGDASGSCTLDGKEINVSSPRRAMQSGVGIVHQEVDLVPELSVAENIFLGLEGSEESEPSYWNLIDRSRLQRAAAELLTRHGLGLSPGVSVGLLPASGQQITQIARVLALRSRVVIFDEPTARLGLRDRETLFGIFRALRAEGRRIVFVTHYLDEVMAIADRASVMRDGRMVDTLRVTETNVAELSRLMVGEIESKVQKREPPAERETAIRVKSLSREPDFRNVTFEIGKGEIVGLVGHLGSGRHELVRSILGVRNAEGQIEISANVKRKKSQIIGFVPEDRRAEGIFPALSIAENISLGILRNGSMFRFLPKRVLRTASSGVIERLQVKASGADQKVGELSGGNQQKVVFGRETVASPGVYVIESPTVGVDVKAAVELHRQILSLSEKGAAILLASDDLDEITLLSDRILVMFRGAITRSFDAGDLSNRELVAAMGAA